MEPPKNILGLSPATSLPAAPVETGGDTQATLPSSPTYKELTSFHMQPSWGEKFLPGLKKAGLGLGCVVFGALSIGWIPVSMVAVTLLNSGLLLGRLGQEYDEKGQIVGTVGKVRYTVGNILCLIGGILMGPVIGLNFCVLKLRGIELPPS